MRYRVVLLVAVTLCLFSGAFGFLGVPRSETLRRNYSVRFASYADQLRTAKLAKAGRGGSSPVLPKAPTPPVASATRAESVAQPSSALPFEQDVYENLNFVIGKLSSRMKSGKVLSEEELDQFKAAVGVIVSDAGTVPAVPQQSQAAFSRTQPPQDSPDSSTSASKFEGIEAPHELKRLSLQEADASSPFSALHGLGNTWQIPGMEVSCHITSQSIMSLNSILY